MAFMILVRVMILLGKTGPSFLVLGVLETHKHLSLEATGDESPKLNDCKYLPGTQSWLPHALKVLSSGSALRIISL